MTIRAGFGLFTRPSILISFLVMLWERLPAAIITQANAFIRGWKLLPQKY
jgi:hypothetical protein